MDGEIVLDRGETTVMKLDDGEQRLMDEIQISAPQPRRVPRPKPTPYARPRVSHAMEHQEEIDAFVNPNKQSAPPPVHGGPSFDDDDDVDDPYMDAEFDDEPQQQEMPSAGYASVDAEKMDILNKLARLERKGFGVNKRLNAYSSIEDLRNEYKRVTYTIDVDQSIKFSRKALMATVTGLEWANKKYNPFELSLEGWSESIMENLDDYDTVFEELHVKYGQKMQVAPEIKLLMMVGGSAMMFHLTNSMFKAAIPNLQDVLKQNPGLQQSMVSAVQNAVPRQQPLHWCFLRDARSWVRHQQSHGQRHDAPTAADEHERAHDGRTRTRGRGRRRRLRHRRRRPHGTRERGRRREGG